MQKFREAFDVVPECETSEIERAARTSVALDKLVAAHRIDALAYYYEGYKGNDYENIVTSIIAGNTNSRYKFPVPAKTFIEQWSKAGPSHHCAIGIGHLAEKIKKLGFLLDIPVKEVPPAP